MKLLCLAVVIAALALSACGGAKDKLMEQCSVLRSLTPEVGENTCSCMYDVLEAKYGKEKMAYMIENPKTPDSQRMIHDSVDDVAHCMKE